MIGFVERALTADPGASLGTITDQLRVDRHTVTRILREKRQCTFREFRARHVNRSSYYLLKSSNLSIKEIAEKLGFATPRAFSRFVTRATGSRPKDIRSEHPHAEREGPLLMSARPARTDCKGHAELLRIVLSSAN